MTTPHTPSLDRMHAALRAYRLGDTFTFMELCARAHVEYSNSRHRHLARWLEEGVIHLAGWREDTAVGRKPKLYARGPATGAEPVKRRWDKVAAAREWKAKVGYHQIQNRRRTFERRRKRMESRAARAESMLALILGVPPCH